MHTVFNFYFSFLARGFINALPVTVWEAIKNPTTRFVYDNMLKVSIIYFIKIKYLEVIHPDTVAVV